MELKNLRAFVEVVRQNGFTAAGKTLCATQSTVSKAVRQIEDEIGAPLLDRLGPKPRLTSIGEAVYARALRLLAERDDLLAEIAELRGLKRGILRLGLPPVGSGILFAPLVHPFPQKLSRNRYSADRARQRPAGGNSARRAKSTSPLRCCRWTTISNGMKSAAIR